MPVKAKDIKGFLVEKFHYNEDDYRQGFNQAIGEQGERSVGLNRKKLAHTVQVLFEALHMEFCYKVADALISAEADIIEYKKRNNKLGR